MDAEALFRAHARFVAAFVQRLGVAPAEVDDVVQEVFVTAHRKGGFVPGRASPRSWLGAIAMRVASNARRSRSRRRDFADPAHIDCAPAPGSDPGRAAEVAESLARVQRALDHLDLQHRTVLLLFELEGEGCQAIAEALDVPVGTVYSRLHTARRRFREAYATTAPRRSTPTPDPLPEGA